MKFGMRKPSLKRSISARTTGKIKRSINRTVNPLYGKKGMGYVNDPKKAVYNKVYNKTTFSVKDALGSSGSKRSANTPTNNQPGCFRVPFPIILIIVGVFTIPVGLIFISIGLFLLAVKNKNNNDSGAQQENQIEPPSPISKPTPSQAPSPTETTANAPEKKTETHRVAGTSYRLDDIKNLLGENYVYECTKKELIADGYIGERIYEFDVYTGAAVLEPEPDNPHDPRAIKVIAAGVHIGYIKAGSCAHIHKVLREGRLEKVNVEIKGGKYKIVLEDFDEEGESVYSLERDDIPFSAVLTLTLK